MTTRRPFSFLSATLCGLALGASFLLAGCGGSNKNGNGGPNGLAGQGSFGSVGGGTGANGNNGGGNTGGSNTGGGNTGGGTGSSAVAAGSYQGVYLYTSGASSPDAGTIAFTVTPSGGVNGTTMDYTGDGSTSNFTGTVSSNGSVTTNGGAVSAPFAQNSTTHVYSASVTQHDGTTGPISVGLAPTASPLAGSYSGTFVDSTRQFPVALTISTTGVVTGTLGTLAVANQGFTFSGYVDTNGNLYLADRSGGEPENIFAALTLNGTSLTGLGHSSAADGSSTTGTLSLTKQ